MSCAEAHTAPHCLKISWNGNTASALAYGLRNRFLPVLNGFLQALGEGCLVLDRDLRQCLRAAHVVLKLTPEGLCGQRGQFLPVLGLEQAFDFSAGLGNAFFARARGVLQPLLAVFLHQALQAQLQFQVRLEQVEGDGFIAHGQTPYG